MAAIKAILTTGVQYIRTLTFPATQQSSSDVNTLDDYEEGTWTPALGGSGGQSGQAYTVQVGRYTKIGRVVHVSGIIVLSALGTVTGTGQIQGLPFTTHNTSNGFQAGAITWLGMTSNLVAMALEFGPNVTAMDIKLATAAANGLSNSAQANFANTTQLIFSATYFTAT